MTTPADPRAAGVLPLPRREHEDAIRNALRWLAEHHRKGWQNAFKATLALWRRNMASRQGRTAISFDFLWQALGLSR